MFMGLQIWNDLVDQGWRRFCISAGKALVLDRLLEAPRISRQSAHEGGKVVSPKHRPSLPLRKDTHFC
jgi:hypothetical protein